MQVEVEFEASTDPRPSRSECSLFTIQDWEDYEEEEEQVDDIDVM